MSTENVAASRERIGEPVRGINGWNIHHAILWHVVNPLAEYYEGNGIVKSFLKEEDAVEYARGRWSPNE